SAAAARGADGTGGHVTVRGATVAPLSGRLRTEPVGSFPGEIGATSRRDIDTGFEPGELSESIRERTHSVKSRIECATADRPVAKPSIEDDVTVQIKSRRVDYPLVVSILAGKRFSTSCCIVRSFQIISRPAVVEIRLAMVEPEPEMVRGL